MTTETRWFQGRRAALGTRHGKEQVIAPLAQRELGIGVVVPPDFDSDRFGTFTREIARTDSQLDTARKKAFAAMDITGLDLGLASEGTFGGHPQVPFLPGNVEVVLLVDRLNGLEIRGVHIATDVRFVHDWVTNVEEAFAFASRAGFPEHGLVVRPGPDEPNGLIKGIVEHDQLQKAVEVTLASSLDGRIYVESDLRAHMNPFRMMAIREATLDLIANAQRACPSCGAPGFRIVEDRPGLPCRWCTTPTDGTLALVFACQLCGHQHEKLYPDGRTEAEPGECSFCNP